MNIFYALDPKVLEKYYSFRDAEKRVKEELTPQMIGDIRAAVYSEPSADSQPYTVENGVALISIAGMLTPKPTLSASLFGEAETTYSDISNALAAADSDYEVESISLLIDSPGGYWDGLDVAMQNLSETKKPVTAYIENMATSAAYGLASQADKVVAVSRGVMAGSIGVASEVYDRTEADKKGGVQRHVMTNTTSRDKRPNVATDEGKSVIQSELDDIYDVFEGRIVEGRKAATGDDITESVRTLAGRTVTARKALKLGLIDEIQGSARASKPTETEGDKSASAPALPGGNNKQEGQIMNLTELLEGNPEAKAEHEAKLKAAKAEGVTNAADENTRVMGILEAANVQLSAPLKAALSDTSKDKKDYALAVLEANKELPKPNATALSGVAPAQETSETAPVDAKAAADKEFDAIAEKAIELENKRRGIK